VRNDFGAAYGDNQGILLLRTERPWMWVNPLASLLCKLTYCRWCNSTWGNRLERLHDRHTAEFRAPVDDTTMAAFQLWMGWEIYGDDEEEPA
jgi:hypothetical protein